MKKILSIILALSMILSLIASIPVSANYEEYPEVGISISSMTANVGDIVSVQLYVKGTPTIAQLMYAFSWDRSKFQLWHKTNNAAATSYVSGTLDNPVWGTATYYDEDNDLMKPMFSKMGTVYSNPSSDPNGITQRYGLLATNLSCDQIISGVFVPYDIPVDLNTPFIINTMRFKCIALGYLGFTFVKESDGITPYDPDIPSGVILQSQFGVDDEITIDYGFPPPPPPRPPVALGVAPSYYGGHDGKITGLVNPSDESGASIEYKKNGDAGYSTVAGCEITGLASGKYNVRYAETFGFHASAPFDVIVPIPPPQGIIGEPGKIIGTTGDMEYKLSASASWTQCPGGTISGLTAGTYQVRYIGTSDLPPSASVDVTVLSLPIPEAPTGLVGVPPSIFNGTDGKIAYTTAAMEYKKSGTQDAYASCSDVETTGLSPGDYLVRVKAVAGVNQAGLDATVTIYWPFPPPPPPPVGLFAASYARSDYDLDGKITGVTTAMEYRKAEDTHYCNCVGPQISNLTPGTYYIRYAATETKYASPDATVIVPQAPKVADIDLALPVSNSVDNNYSATIVPTELNTNVQYEYGIALSAAGDAYNGPYGQWFDIKADGTGTWTKGLINSKVQIPLTYYYMAPGQNLRIIIRDKNHHEFTKTLQPIPNISVTGNTAGALTTNNSMNGFGLSINDFFTNGTVPGVLSPSGNPSPRQWPVGIPFAYIIAPMNGGVPSYNDARWQTTISYYDTPTSKASFPSANGSWLIYPQDPNGDMLYIKTLTCATNIAGGSDATTGYLGSARPPYAFGTTPLLDIKISAPLAPSGISDSGITYTETVVLNGLKPYKYEYVLSDSATQPADWSGALPLQSFTGSASFAFNGEHYMYIRTKDGMIMEGSPASKVSLHDYIPVGLDVGKGTVVKNGTTFTVTKDASALYTYFLPSVSEGSVISNVHGNFSYIKIDGKVYWKVTAEQLAAGDVEITFDVTDAAQVTTGYSISVNSITVSNAITGYDIKRGTIGSGVIAFDYDATTMAVIPILASPTAKYTVTVGGVARNTCNSGGGLYSTILTFADIYKTVVFTVTDVSVGSAQYTFTVDALLKSTAINSYVTKRGTVSGANITFDKGAATMAVAPVLASATAKYTVTVGGVARNTCNSGNGLFSTIFTLADVGKTAVFTVTDAGSSQQYTFTVSAAAGNTAITSYVTKRGTVSGANIIFGAKQVTMAVIPVLASDTAKYTVTVGGIPRNTCNSGDGLYSTIFTLADIGKTAVFTVTDAGSSQQYTFTVAGA